MRSANPRLKPDGGIKTISSEISKFSKISSVSGIPRNPIVGSLFPTFKPSDSPRTAKKPPIPSSEPFSSNTRANIRWRRETPPPVIQCFLPLIIYLSPRFSARVVICDAALPASGSVIQIAGLSPFKTKSAARRFWVSVP